MNSLVYLFVGLVQAVLSVLEFAMLFRAILSFLPLDEDNKLVGLVTCITEPLITPFRLLFDRFGWFEESILDIPFFAAYMVLVAVSFFMGAF